MTFHGLETYLLKSCGEEKNFSVIRRWVDFVKNSLNIEYKDNNLLYEAIDYGNYDIASYLTDHFNYNNQETSYFIHNRINHFDYEGSSKSELRLCFLFDKFPNHSKWKLEERRQAIIRGYERYIHNKNNKIIKPYKETILYKVNELFKQKYNEP